MTRFYFDVRRNGRLEEDKEGEELPSKEAAIEEAMAAARELVAEKVRTGDVVDGDAFEIRDEHGEVVHILPFRSVLRLD